MSRRTRAALKSALASRVTFPPLPKRISKAALSGAGLPRGGPSYAQALSSIKGKASERGTAEAYMEMVLKPTDRTKSVRYPDDCIVPTALTHLMARTTYVVPVGETTVITLLYGKVLSVESPPAPGFTRPQISYASGTFVPPAPNIPTTSFDPSAKDYGGPQDIWESLSAVDRTLAAGIQVEVIALPATTFMPSGTIYCLQIQDLEVQQFDPATTLGPVTEDLCIQAVTANKGFSITVNELQKMGGVVLPLLPQGPQSYVFSDTNSPPTRGSASSFEFVGGSSILTPPPQSYVVWSGGAVATMPNLVILGFGLQPGLELRFEYAHNIEYIPRIGAAGLLDVKACMPSTALRETISKSVAAVQANVQGSTSAGSVAPVLGGGSNVARVAAMAVKGALSVIPGGGLLGSLAKGAADVFGAPAWLKSAISIL